MKNLSGLFKLFTRLILSATARRTYIVFIGNGIAMLFAFLFTIIIIRLLSISDFGYFSVIFTFLIVISELADVGIGNSLSRFLPPLVDKKDQLLSFLKTAFSLQLGIAAVLSITIFIFSSTLSNIFFHTKQFTYLFKITSFGVFFAILANFFLYSLSALQKFLHASIISSCGGILRFVVLILLLPLSLVTLTNVIWAQLVAYILLAIIALLFIGLHFLHTKVSIESLKKLLHFTFYLGTARSITAIANRLDVLMLIAYTNSIETGIYATASRVISIYPLLSGSFTTVVAPKLSTISEVSVLRKFMIKVIIVTLAMISTIIVLILIAYPFMTILFGVKTAPAVGVFQILLLSMIFFVASIPAVSLAIYYLKKPHILTVNSILQLFIVILGNLIFIPIYGKFGPAYSLLLAYSVTFFLTSYLSFYYYKKKIILK